MAWFLYQSEIYTASLLKARGRDQAYNVSAPAITKIRIKVGKQLWLNAGGNRALLTHPLR
jgi:hypothetical protein